jgi:hypothetical protein
MKDVGANVTGACVFLEGQGIYRFTATVLDLDNNRCSCEVCRGRRCLGSRDRAIIRGHPSYFHLHSFHSKDVMSAL